MSSIPVYFENRTIKRCKTCGNLLPVEQFYQACRRAKTKFELPRIEHSGSCRVCTLLNNSVLRVEKANSYINHKQLRAEFLREHGEELFYCKVCDTYYKKRDCRTRFTIGSEKITHSTSCKVCEEKQVLSKIERIGY